MDKAKMGTFIKEQRMALGMTQQQLAEQLHITNKAISRWETGNAYPDISLLDDLAAVLSVSVEELCRGERIALPADSVFGKINEQFPQSHYVHVLFLLLLFIIQYHTFRP